MKRNGAYYKFESKEDFVSYFNGNYGCWYFNNDNKSEVLYDDFYSCILRNNRFPIILFKELQDPDTRSMGYEYSFTPASWNRTRSQGGRVENGKRVSHISI